MIFRFQSLCQNFKSFSLTTQRVLLISSERGGRMDSHARIAVSWANHSASLTAPAFCNAVLAGDRRVYWPEP